MKLLLQGLLAWAWQLALLTTVVQAADGARPFLIKSDGSVFFPIGLYGFPQDRKDQEIRREASAAGINFLVGHDSASGLFSRTFDIPGGPPDPDAKIRRGSLLDLTHQVEKKKAMLLEIVETATRTPGVILLQGPDEPNYFPFGIRPGPSVEGLAAGAATLRSSSKLPLWINFGPTGDHLHPEDFDRLRPYLAIPDVVSVDIYPIGGGSDLQESPFAERGPASVGVFTRNLVRLVSCDGVQRKPVWMVLQAFGWGDLAKTSKPPEAWTGRPPTLEEMRFMTFDAIINGAGGILYWGAPFLPDSDQNATWESLKLVCAELRDLLRAITGDRLAADHRVISSNNNIEIAVFKRDSAEILFLANRSVSEQQTILYFHGPKPKAFKLLGRSRVQPSKAPGFDLHLKPLEVSIFEVEL